MGCCRTNELCLPLHVPSHKHASSDEILASSCCNIRLFRQLSHPQMPTSSFSLAFFIVPCSTSLACNGNSVCPRECCDMHLPCKNCSCSCQCDVCKDACFSSFAVQLKPTLARDPLYDNAHVAPIVMFVLDFCREKFNLLDKTTDGLRMRRWEKVRIAS